MVALFLRWPQPQSWREAHQQDILSLFQRSSVLTSMILLCISFAQHFRSQLRAMGGKNKGGRKKGTGMMKVSGLSQEWDSANDIRERLRSGGPLLHPQSSNGEDVQTCSLNAGLIKPMVERMVKSPVLGHPPIDPLRDEVEKLFVMNKRHPAPEFADLQKMAWRLRFMVCFVKMKARRNEPSREPCLNLLVFPAHLRTMQCSSYALS